MEHDIIHNLLLVNTLVLIAASIFYTPLHKGLKLNPGTYPSFIFWGLISAVLGIFLTVISRNSNPLFVFDAKPVVVGVTALTSTPLSTGIAVLLLSVFLLIYGGAKALTGILIVFVSAALGLFWRRFVVKKIADYTARAYLGILLFSVLTQVLMLLCYLTLPYGAGLELIQKYGFWVFSIYSVCQFVLCILIFADLRRMKLSKSIADSEARLRTLFEQSPVGIALKRGNKTLYCNSKYSELLGLTIEEENALGWQKITHPDDLEADRELFRRFKAREINYYEHNKRFLRPDGSVIYVSMTIVYVVRNGWEHNQDYLCLLKDVTEQSKAMQALQSSLEDYKKLSQDYKNQLSLINSLINSTSDQIHYKDKNNVYQGCNAAYLKYGGVTEADIVGKTPYEVFSKERADKITELDSKVLETKTPIRYETRGFMPHSDSDFFDVIRSPYYDDNGEVLGVVFFARDITELKQRENRILYMSEHDALTGLHNRRYFEKQLVEIDKPENLPLSVIMCDVNGLNLINNSFGHQRGDELLLGVAGVLNDCRREGDVLCRTGGDEFVFLMPNTNVEEAKQVFNNILKTYEERAALPESKLKFSSVALGYAAKMERNDTLTETLSLAESAMYRRKLLSHKGIHSSILGSIKSTLYEKNIETEAHSGRMAKLARQTGRLLGLHSNDLDNLELAAELHDIGKIVIDLSILNKKGELSKKEWELIREHPAAGYRITQSIPELQPISGIVLYHHERWDGTGYPQGLADVNIPLLARIISIVDAFDAMTEKRPYREKLSLEEAKAEIMRCAGTQFDPTIAALFVESVLLAESQLPEHNPQEKE